ncbi:MULTISPECIES: YfhD family protein [Cohnella]|uniref:YfhD family protein n=1 Tax=Cohnella TaxID=329857 RepID=UPI0009BC403A|nr:MULTISPECIES: YfhD family protein [Cohnella]MBN2983289.1 YfhD family protein [Cohnella algarum]
MSLRDFFNQKPFRSNPPAKLPVASAEDVEFSQELADEDDLEAQQRAEEADRRAALYKGE